MVQAHITAYIPPLIKFFALMSIVGKRIWENLQICGSKSTIKKKGHFAMSISVLRINNYNKRNYKINFNLRKDFRIWDEQNLSICHNWPWSISYYIRIAPLCLGAIMLIKVWKKCEKFGSLRERFLFQVQVKKFKNRLKYVKNTKILGQTKRSHDGVSYFHNVFSSHCSLHGDLHVPYVEVKSMVLVQKFLWLARMASLEIYF